MLMFQSRVSRGTFPSICRGINISVIPIFIVNCSIIGLVLIGNISFCQPPVWLLQFIMVMKIMNQQLTLFLVRHLFDDSACFVVLKLFINCYFHHVFLANIFRLITSYILHHMITLCDLIGLYFGGSRMSAYDWLNLFGIS